MKLGKRYLFLGVLLMAVLLTAAACSKEKTQENSSDSNVEEEKEQAGLEFPYELEDGKLEVDSVFQFSGTNPDCSNEDGEDIGSIQLKNNSEDYLEMSDITVILEDGTKLKFRVEDIPPGQSILAFETENQSYDDQVKIIDITSEVSYSEDTSLMEDNISIFVDDLGIHLTNKGTEELGNLTVKYHCYMDENIFGGISYESFLDSLMPGEEIVLEASECYLGEASVVNIKN